MGQGNIIQMLSTSSTSSSPTNSSPPQPSTSSSPTITAEILANQTTSLSSSNPSNETATAPSPPASTSPTDWKPHFIAADIGIGIASAIGFLALVAVGVWLYRQGQKSQAVVHERHIKRLSDRRDEEAGLEGISIKPRPGYGYGYGFDNGVEYKNVEYENGHKTYDDPPFHLAELMGSAPDNMMF